jgi:hypothetical protein
LSKLPIAEKRDLLAKLDAPVAISAEADMALRQSDIIIYGPGTQFSSLLPSYKTKGVPQAIQESQASVKIFVANLEEDHDIQGLTVSDLVNTALNVMGDPDGQKGLISHIFVNEPRVGRDRQTPLGEVGEASYKSAKIVRDGFESVSQAGAHSGYKVTRLAMEVFQEAKRKSGSQSLEIYVDLLNRGRAFKKLSQEFLDIPWTDHFESVRLIVNRLSVDELSLPDFASSATSDYRGTFTEVEALLEWLTKRDSEYLVTLAGDGEYRLQDILIGVQILKMSSFGAIYGSRVQSSNQLRSALDMAYGERTFLRHISFLGAFMFTMIFALRFRMIMTDPFTGFRIYSRSKINEAFVEDLKRTSAAPASIITILAVKHKLEIAEIPIVYRTFKGFTKPGWRIVRGLKNISGLLFS